MSKVLSLRLNKVTGDEWYATRWLGNSKSYTCPNQVAWSKQLGLPIRLESQFELSNDSKSALKRRVRTARRLKEFELTRKIETTFEAKVSNRKFRCNSISPAAREVQQRNSTARRFSRSKTFQHQRDFPNSVALLRRTRWKVSYLKFTNWRIRKIVILLKLP